MTTSSWTPPRTAAEIRAALRAAGSKLGAAKQLGISRPTLDAWIRHYGISVEERLVVR
jgi:transcriptional regulator with PAS, ATPase and Fis domain